MDNKFNNMLEEFLKNNEFENYDDIDAKLKEFMMKVNRNEIAYENTPLDDAYELLDRAKQERSITKANQLAKEAYEVSNECFDAIIFLAENERNIIKRKAILDEGLEFEKNRLIQNNYFSKDKIGHFYGIFQTRPYIRGLYTKAMYLLEEGKIGLAGDICKEILRLNNNDNTGARYMLMAIYAYLEDENKALKLYKKYPENNLEMLLPLFILYFKKENDKKAHEYFELVNKANPNLVKLFKRKFDFKDDDAPFGYYSRGEISEVLMYFNNYGFLIASTPGIVSYIKEATKRKKKK